MKRILYFDCSSGISGDMVLGALIHLGVDINKLREELGKLDLSSYNLVPEISEVSGIAGINLEVIIENLGEHENEHHHRTYSSIKDMIEKSQLNENVKTMAISIFSVIGEAEASVHNMDMKDVAFHEVGAVDSIVDIVGAAICVDILKVDEIMCTPVHDGSGHIKCQHGIIPVPVPAVMEMLKGSGISIVTEDIDTEMVTPTGFGILKGLKATCVKMPEINLIDVGYGFGKRKTGKFNGLRVVLGNSVKR